MFGFFRFNNPRPAMVRRRSSESAAASQPAAQSRIVVPEHGPFAGATPAQSGSWIAYVDAHGNACWCNDATGAWTYQLYSAGGYASTPTPPGTWAPTPVGMQPVPWNPYNFYLQESPVPTRKPGEKDKQPAKKGGEREQGYWQAVFDKHGKKLYWQHTVTKQITYVDPYY